MKFSSSLATDAHRASFCIESRISAMIGKSFGSNEHKYTQDQIRRKRELEAAREFRNATKEVWED